MTELTPERTRLISPYIDRKLKAETIKPVLHIDSSCQTIYQIYLISNGIKEMQDFCSIDSDEYSLTATVKTECGFLGEAKRQVWAITHLQPLLSKKPLYTITCELTHLMSNDIKYRCTFSSKRQDEIYTQIQDIIKELEEIL